MQEGPGPSSTSADPPLYQPTQHTGFEPISLLYNAISYGEAVWEHIHQANIPHNVTPLLNLSYIIEDHLHNLRYMHIR